MPITSIPATAEGMRTYNLEGTPTMKTYTDETNRVSISGTDCMPKSTAMIDGRLQRVLAAIDMVDCMYGLNDSDDEVADVLRASFAVDRKNLAVAEQNGSLGELFNKLDMLECLHSDHHGVDEVTEVMHAFFDLFSESSNPAFAKAPVMLES